MKNNFEIVEYRKEFQSAIVDLITTIQQKEFHLPITFEDQPDLKDIQSFYDVFLIAVNGGNVLGTVGIKVIDDFAIIRKMFVKKEGRGSGVAQGLLQAIEERIASLGIQKIYLGTTAVFQAAHRFYGKNDYQEIDQEELPLTFPVMKVDTKFYFKKLL